MKELHSNLQALSNKIKYRKIFNKQSYWECVRCGIFEWSNCVWCVEILQKLAQFSVEFCGCRYHADVCISQRLHDLYRSLRLTTRLISAVMGNWEALSFQICGNICWFLTSSLCIWSFPNRSLTSSLYISKYETLTRNLLHNAVYLNNSARLKTWQMISIFMINHGKYIFFEHTDTAEHSKTIPILTWCLLLLLQCDQIHERMNLGWFLWVQAPLWRPP